MHASTTPISISAPPTQQWTHPPEHPVERLYIADQGTVGHVAPTCRIAAELQARGYDVRTHISRGYGWLLDRFALEGADDQAPADLGEEFQGHLGLWNAMKEATPPAAAGTYRIVREMLARRAEGHRDFLIATMGTHLLAYPVLQAFLPGQWAILDPVHFADADSGYPTLVFQDYRPRPAWMNRLANRFLIGLLNLPPVRRIFVDASEKVLSQNDRDNPEIIHRLRRARFDPRLAVFRLYIKNLDGTVRYADPEQRIIFGPLIVASIASPSDNGTGLRPAEQEFFDEAAAQNIPVILVSFSSMKPHNDPNTTVGMIVETARQLEEAGDAIRLFYIVTQPFDSSRFKWGRNLYISSQHVNWEEVITRCHGGIIHGGIGSSALFGVLKKPFVTYYRVSEQRSNALRCGALKYFSMKDFTVPSLVSSIRLVLNQPQGQDWSQEQLAQWLNSYQIAADEIERQLYEWAQVPA